MKISAVGIVFVVLVCAYLIFAISTITNNKRADDYCIDKGFDAQSMNGLYVGKEIICRKEIGFDNKTGNSKWEYAKIERTYGGKK